MWLVHSPVETATRHRASKQRHDIDASRAWRVARGASRHPPDLRRRPAAFLKPPPRPQRQRQRVAMPTSARSVARQAECIHSSAAERSVLCARRAPSPHLPSSRRHAAADRDSSPDASTSNSRHARSRARVGHPAFARRRHGVASACTCSPARMDDSAAIVARHGVARRSAPSIAYLARRCLATSPQKVTSALKLSVQIRCSLLISSAVDESSSCA
jgi:hypothetical protein